MERTRLLTLPLAAVLALGPVAVAAPAQAAVAPTGIAAAGTPITSAKAKAKKKKKKKKKKATTKVRRKKKTRAPYIDERSYIGIRGEVVSVNAAARSVTIKVREGCHARDRFGKPLTASLGTLGGVVRRDRWEGAISDVQPGNYVQVLGHRRGPTGMNAWEIKVLR